MAQRGLPEDDVDYVMRHGQRVYNAGVCAYFLGKRDIPKEDFREDRYRRLEGPVALVDSCGEQVITAYRNKKALRKFRRRTKYDLQCVA